MGNTSDTAGPRCPHCDHLQRDLAKQEVLARAYWGDAYKRWVEVTSALQLFAHATDASPGDDVLEVYRRKSEAFHKYMQRRAAEDRP